MCSTNWFWGSKTSQWDVHRTTQILGGLEQLNHYSTVTVLYGTLSQLCLELTISVVSDVGVVLNTGW